MKFENEKSGEGPPWPAGSHARLRVCHLLSGDLWAGAEVMAWHLIRHLRRFSGLEVSALILNEGRLAEELRKLQVPIRILDEQGVSFAHLVLKTRAILRQWSPHVIHSHRYKENILAFLARSRASGARLVATQHGMPENDPRCMKTSARVIAHLNRLILARGFDRLVGVSQDIRANFIRRFNFAADQLSVIYNGLALPEVRKLPSTGRELVVGSAGRLVPVKGFELLVEIARVIAAEGAPVRFVLAGEGPQRGRLEEQIARYGVGRSILLKGHLDHMADFYREIDVYLNTSVHEGIPMSILEAMAHGLPVIAPAVGGIVEIITSAMEGLLMHNRHPRSFADACLLLQRDPELRQRMGHAARETVRSRFSAEVMARQYEHLYRTLVDRKNKPHDISG
jgi:L-malate glycosyltransferase